MDATPRGAPQASPTSTSNGTEASDARRDYATALQMGVDINTGPSFGRGAVRLAYRLLSEGTDREVVQTRIADAATIAADHEGKELPTADAWNVAGEIVQAASDALDKEQRQQERLRRAQEHVEQESEAEGAAELNGDGLDHPGVYLQDDGDAQPERRWFHRLSEIDSRPIEWIAEGLVPAGVLTLAHATDKAGKTLLWGWELAHAVVSGTPFLARPGFAGFPVRQGRVLMALLDDAAPINAYRRDLFGLAAFDDDVVMMTNYPEADDGMPLAAEAVLRLLRGKCKAFRPSLVILDSLYQLIPGGRDAGNDSARMGPLMHLIDSLTKEGGAAVVLIAHDSKGEDDVAGSHVIRAKAKQRLHLQKYPLRQPPRDGEPREKDTGKRLLRVTGKFGSEAMHALMLRHPGRFEYISDDLDAARRLWIRERQASTETVVMAWFEAGNEGTFDDATKGVGRRREDVVKAIKALVITDDLETYKLPSTGGRRGTGYRLRGVDSPKKNPHEGTKVDDAASPCETSPSDETLSFRALGMGGNESPPAEPLVPSPGTKVRTFVPSSASSLGAEDGNGTPPPFANDARDLDADALVADDVDPDADDDLFRCPGCGETDCAGCEGAAA